jgi:hypothetical protein
LYMASQTNVIMIMIDSKNRVVVVGYISRNQLFKLTDYQ